MTDAVEKVALTGEDMCDICCRPRSRHKGTDLQCPETVYFREMPSTQPDDSVARIVVLVRNWNGPTKDGDTSLIAEAIERGDWK